MDPASHDAQLREAAFSELDRVFVGKEDLQQHMSTSLGQLITSYR
jgi:hypothetical protein